MHPTLPEADRIASTDRLPTPALVIDGATAERNIRRLAEYAAQHQLELRPHTKTHKSRNVAALQMAAGAIGLTTAKVGEAEVMSAVSSDLLLAYPAVDPARTNRVAQLAVHHTIRVAVDSREAAVQLSDAAKRRRTTIGVLVDLDVGLGRTGLQTPDEALRLAQFIDAAPGLRLDGLFCYPGQISVPAAEQVALLDQVDQKLAETLYQWSNHGLQASIVSGGSTPTAYQSHLLQELTEIRPGSYVFNDMNTVRKGFCGLEDVAATIVCTVVSAAVPGQVVLDGGSKALTTDPCTTAEDGGYGHIVEHPQAKITRLTEEHAQVDVRSCERKPTVGERVTVVPNHICPCVNLQDYFWWRHDDGSLEAVPVDARGLLS